jgi:hypothetical protein
MSDTKVTYQNGIKLPEIEASNNSIGVISPSYGFGQVPIGAIIPIGNAAAWSLPASGQIKEGYALCNGQAFPAGKHPSFTGNMPNLSDERFLQGTSSANQGTGGNAGNSKTLATANLPSHNHSIAHSHDLKHGHTASVGGPGTHGHALAEIYANGTGGNQGQYEINAGNDNTAKLFTENSGSHSHTATVADYIGTVSTLSTTLSGSSGSGTAFDIRPLYFNVVYVMRVI